MKFKGTLVFAVFAIALGLYVYFIEYKKAAKDEEQKSQEEKVIAFEPEKVKSLTIKNSKGQLEIERGDGNSWKITKPLADLADESAVSSTLTDLAGEKFDQIVEGDDLKSFGLDAPVSTITINFKEGAPKTVSVGADAAIPGKVYLQRADNKKILYANTSIKTQLEKGMTEFRDKRIFRKNKDDIQHLVLKMNTKDNKGTVSLIKKETAWELEGKSEVADDDTVAGIIKTLDGLRATDFPSEEAADKNVLKKFGLNTPTLDLTLAGKDNASLAHMLFSPTKDNNKVFISIDGSPTIYQVFSSASDALLKKPQEFRNKKLPLLFKKDDVAEIYAKTSLADVHLAKKGDQWGMPLPDDNKVVSQTQVTNFLDKISGLRVAEYLESEKPQGLTTPAGHVTLKDAKGDLLLDLVWGERSQNKRNYFAKSNKYKGNFTIEATTLEGVPIQTLIESKSTPTPAPTAASTLPPKVGATP